MDLCWSVVVIICNDLLINKKTTLFELWTNTPPSDVLCRYLLIRLKRYFSHSLVVSLKNHAIPCFVSLKPCSFISVINFSLIYWWLDVMVNLVISSITNVTCTALLIRRLESCNFVWRFHVQWELSIFIWFIKSYLYR